MTTDANTIKQYNEHAREYHAHVSDPTDSTFHSYYEKPAIRTLVPDIHNLEVLSIGCGSGLDARWLAENGAKRVVGIDISSGLIEIAKTENPDIEFHVMDMEKLDFPDESFDVAYSSLAIHYIDDWTPALREARRVLKPGGRYIFSCGHPIDSAVEFEIEGDTKLAALGRKINLQTRARKVYGDYLAKDGNGIKPVQGNIGGVDVTVYHRPISKMIEHIIDSGFQILAMVEPQPEPSFAEIAPEMFEQLSRIPFFMIWSLQKHA